MSSTADVSPAHLRAERTIRAMLERNGIDAPDEVQYDSASLRLLWHDRKVAVVIDLDPGMPA